MNYQYPPLGEEYEFQDFLRDLYNCHYNTDSFESYRTKGASQYGIDIYSPTLHIAVQAKKKKLLRSEPVLIKELMKDLEETIIEIDDFPFPINKIILASTTKKFSAVQDECIRLSQLGSRSVQFWSWEDIEKEIPHCSTVQNKYYSNFNRPVYPKELITTSQVDTANILGRESDVVTIESILTQKRIICIQSIGGVGKTTFAKYFYQKNHSSYDHLLWLNHLTDFKKDLAFNTSLEVNLKLAELPDNSTERRYQAILSAVIAIPGKTLIIIDNLEHEDGSNVEQQVSKFLTKQDLHVLITSRQIFQSIPIFELPLLSNSARRELFSVHCPKEVDKANLDLLLTLCSGNALLIKLVAKTIHNGIGLTIDTMISRLEENDTEASELGFDIEQSFDNEIVNARLHKQISRIFEVSQLKNDHQLYLVFTLSILPSIPISISELFEFFLYNENDKSLTINAISSLHKQGIITRIGDEVKMHQIVQNVVRMQTSNFFVYLNILNSLLRSLDKANKVYSEKGRKLQQYAESVLAKMKGPKTASVQQPLTMLKNNLFIALRYLGENNKAKELGKQLIEALPEMKLLPYQDNAFLATLYHNIATYYMDESLLPEAEQYFRKAISTIGNKFTPNGIHFYNGLFTIYYKENRFKEAIECCQKALEMLQMPEAAGYNYLLANLINNFAMVNLKMGELEKAANFFLAAIKIHKETDTEEKNSSALAGYYSNAALVYSLAEKHEMAIQFALHAIKYRELLHLENDYELLNYYSMAAQVYEKAGDEKEAAEIRSMIEVAKASLKKKMSCNNDYSIQKLLEQFGT